MPMMNNYNQWRIDRVVTHWRIINKNKNDWRGDVCNHGVVVNVPNNSFGEDGAFEDLMYNTDQTELENFLLNYTQLRGVKARRVNIWAGRRAHKPYVSVLRTTYSKNTNAAPTAQGDLVREYPKYFHYADSAVRYETPLFLILPGMVKTKHNYTGTLGAGTVTMAEEVSDFPRFEIWSEVYVSVKQCDLLSLGTPRIMLKDPQINEINTDFNKIKEDVKGGVMDHILGSNPVFGAVAAVAGIRSKRPRDEFKM